MLVCRRFTGGGGALSSFWRKQIIFASGQRRIKPVSFCEGGKNWKEEPNITIITFIIITNNNKSCEMCKLCLTSGSCDRVTESSQETHGRSRWLQDSSLSDMKINSVPDVMPLMNSQPPGI